MNRFQLEDALRAMQKDHREGSRSWWYLEGILEGLGTPALVDSLVPGIIKQKAADLAS